MPSFATLFLLATGVFAAMTVAAPVGSLMNPGGGIPPVTAIGAGVNTLETRRDTSLPAILTDFKSQISSVSDKMKGAVAAGKADAATVTPIIRNLIPIIGNAIVDVQGLSGRSTNDVLGSVTVPDLAHLLISVLPDAVLNISSIVVRGPQPSEGALITLLLAELGGVLGELLSTTFGNINGLFAAILPLWNPFNFHFNFPKI